MLITPQLRSQNSSSSPNTKQATAKRAVEPNDEFHSGADAPQLSSDEQQFHTLGKRFHSRESQRAHNVEISSNYPGREGYDKNFLSQPLDLPKIGSSFKGKIATLIGNPDKTELEYTNFSIVMNKERRQAFYAAVNIDGAKIVDRPRNGKWTTDSRIPREHQLGNEAYKSNPIDRGHLVRRRDPVWGPDAQRANTDTFAYTNAGLQHGRLNQKTWLDMENYILNQAKSKDQKLTVITGPVFADNDPSFNNKGRMKKATKMPQEFWKVVAWNDPEEGLKGAAFIQSQKNYVSRGIFKSDSEFDPSGMSVYQLPLDKLSDITDLDFGDLKDTVGQAKRLSESSKPDLF